MPDDAPDESRRRFLSLLALAAAGTAAASTVAGAVASATTEPDSPEPEAVPWEARRRLMLKAHEDTVLHREE